VFIPNPNYSRYWDSNDERNMSTESQEEDTQRGGRWREDYTGRYGEINSITIRRSDNREV